MITEFEDFCTWVFVVVDDIWEQIAPFFKRPGPAPVCSDSELIAMALIGECRGGIWRLNCSVVGKNIVQCFTTFLRKAASTGAGGT